MGDKKDARSVLAMIEKTIYDLESRIGVLKQEGNPETGKQSERVKQEMYTLTKQLEYARTAKRSIEQELQKNKKEEDRKAIEKILKYAMLVGVISENLRIREAREKAPARRTRSFLFNPEEAADELFETEEFRYVTREDVEDILADQEFQEMAAEDPNRLEREAEDMRAEYALMMERALLHTGRDLPPADFNEQEERFRAFLKRKNGFEEAIRTAGHFVREILPVIGTEEDKAYFSEVMKEVEELSVITRQLQEDFLVGDSSFEKGNGYTKELIEREKRLAKKIEDFGDRKLHGEHGILTMDPNSEEATNAVRVYEHSQMMLSNIQRQMERDAVMQRNNELREKMERWRVYRHLSLANQEEVVRIPESEENNRRAWAKLQRMERMAVQNSIAMEDELSEDELQVRKMALVEGRGGLQESTSLWASGELQTLMEDVGEPARELSKEMVLEKLASLVLHQIITDETKRPQEEPRPYFKELEKRFGRNQFLKMARELAETKEFRNAMKPYIKGKKLRDECTRFLANDQEHSVALKLGGLKRKLVPPNPDRRR